MSHIARSDPQPFDGTEGGEGTPQPVSGPLDGPDYYGESATMQDRTNLAFLLAEAAGALQEYADVSPHAASLSERLHAAWVLLLKEPA